MFVYGYAGFKTLEGADAIKRYRIRGKKGQPRKASGDCLFDLLKGAVDNRKIPVLLSTRIVELIRRGEEVVGAVAEQNS